MLPIGIFKSKFNLFKLMSVILENHFHSSVISLMPKQIFKQRSLPDYKDTPFSSKFCSPPPIQVAHNKISEYLSEKNPRTVQEWEEAKEYFYTEIPILSDANYSSVMMDNLLVHNHFDVAASFMKYLQESNLKPNILTYLQYMAICGKNAEQCGQEKILEAFRKVKSQIDSSPVLDTKRATYVIQGLCGTDQWRSSFNYIKKLTSSPNLEIKYCLAIGALRNGDQAAAWDIITQWIKPGEKLSDKVIKHFIQYANKLQLENQRSADIFMTRFLNYSQRRDVIINKEAASLIQAYFENHLKKWNVTYTKVQRTGECESCARGLELLELSNEEFNTLRKAFLEKSVKKNDIFINTTAEEFEKYCAFIEKHKPFHIVVDGLNVAHSTSKGRSSKNLAYQLLQIVKNLSKNSRKILVFGRKHMSNWNPDLLRRIRHHAILFLTDDSTQDDPFTLYAALASGPHTHVLTLDLMRDHLSRLDDPQLILLFKKWQQSHQIFVSVNEEKKLIFTPPVKHSICVQGNMEYGWHIPFEDNFIREPYEELNNWLCIRRSFL